MGRPTIGPPPLRAAAALLGLYLLVQGADVRAQPALRGVVVEAGTGKPIAFVSVILDGERSFTSSREGAFNFGDVAAGAHVLRFTHISYRERVLTVQWPGEAPLRVELEPSQFTTEKIVVKGARTVSALPVGAISLDRERMTITPGNIANDPLRTLQSQPACATDGIEFLSKMAVRGGDAEEHRVYFDGYPLAHYAHVGGFAGVVYDDMLESTVLVPGAAPIRYTGALSGLILLNSIKPDTTFGSFRYDITSMAGGLSRTAGPSLSVQAAAKSNYFNLPAYQETGIEKRSFRDGMTRVTWSPRERLSLAATVVAADDKETSAARYGPGFTREPERTRKVRSVLAGLKASYEFAGWRATLRPSYSTFDLHDAIVYSDGPRDHRLAETRVHGTIERQTRSYGVAATGETSALRHTGSGGTHDDTPAAAAAEVKFLYRDSGALVLGAGGSREPWTASFEPETYASARVDVAGAVSLSAGYRRSHQSPFQFTERRYVASVAVDAGDLLAAYAPTWKDAPAVRVDQVSGAVAVTLPFDCSVTASGFQRRYENLLTWDWSDFPRVADVHSGGSGHGDGYEVVVARENLDNVSAMVALSRARIWKREGALTGERPGDFDRPRSWQAAASAKVSHRVRISVRWMDVDGRPFTRYDMQSTAPATEDVNVERLPRFRRLDAKVVYDMTNESFGGTIFLDVINLNDRGNTATIYARDVGGGAYTSTPYGGTRFFPIAGVTVRF